MKKDLELAQKTIEDQKSEMAKAAAEKKPAETEEVLRIPLSKPRKSKQR